MIVICYVLHGGAYIVFSQMRSFTLSLVFIALSRAAVGVSSVLNMVQLLRHVDDRYRGRVFSTIESAQWSVMMLSMAARRHRQPVRGPAHHRRGRRSTQFHHRYLLGMGPLHRPLTRTALEGARGDEIESMANLRFKKLTD